MRSYGNFFYTWLQQNVFFPSLEITVGVQKQIERNFRNVKLDSPEILRGSNHADSYHCHAYNYWLV
jgi:hypothetical protein